MSITTKIIWSLVVVVIGSIIAGVIKDLIGVGQYIASGIIVIILFYIWGKSKPEERSIGGAEND